LCTGLALLIMGWCRFKYSEEFEQKAKQIFLLALCAYYAAYAVFAIINLSHPLLFMSV